MLPSTVVAGSYLPARVKAELNWTLPIQSGAKKLPAKRVQEWLTLHGFSVVIDADFGPATRKRLTDFQAAKKLPATGVVDQQTFEALVDPLVRAVAPITPASGATLSGLIVEYASAHVAQWPREAGGPNCGPWVRAYLGWEGKDAKWCAGFTCMALEQAAVTLGKSQPITSSSGCDALALGAKNAKLFKKEADVASGKVPKSSLKPGSFFLVRKTASDWVHVGIVEKADKDTFDTLEGNTDSNGSSNGTEATRRTRGYGGKDFIVW